MGARSAWRLGVVLAAAAVLLVSCGRNYGAPRGEASHSTGGRDGAPDVPGVACLDPRQPQDRPDGGWLPDEGGQIVEGLPNELDRTEASPDLDDVAGQVLAALPDGYRVERQEEASVPGGCVVSRYVLATGDDGSVSLLLQQLDGARSLFSIPLDSTVARTGGVDGGTQLADDFNEEGTRSTVVQATGDGLFAWFTAVSPSAPSLSGWPTTTATLPDQSTVPASDVPLTPDELADVATQVVEQVR